MRVFFVGLGVALVCFAACGGTVDGTEKQLTGKAGVCCPIKGSDCNCAGGGGWAASADECNTSCASDWAVKVVTDEHGCAALQNDSSRCCGCPRPPG